ncbi:hypothetical protein AVDCRST_MAG94-1307 [uncultured Leptolyngbya sp.]|uniref:Uncharacterized protein n=1 Tax=uncultured Leptolyngbya sp. TaxID=332963 RepID=A0A6J4KYJ0_9CYAN|nr:hypothetical protein AVDCRST_MAG94-1307 [uncultured Leptolyngbya sp.]
METSSSTHVVFGLLATLQYKLLSYTKLHYQSYLCAYCCSLTLLSTEYQPALLS